MSGPTEFFVPHSIGFVLLVIAFISVKAPVGPIQIKFLQVSDEVDPVDISLVVSEFSKKEGDSAFDCPNAELIVEEAFSEVVFAEAFP
jgi:hypothetical protein